MTTVRVRVGSETFVVEVGDTQARPIVAVVDGERFEVWPEASLDGGAAPAPAHAPDGRVALAPVPPGGPAVLSPLPGVVTDVAVKPGDSVSVGQELLAIEAMKMKNVVRATRAGRVAQVLVSAGQAVRPSQPLLEYE